MVLCPYCQKDIKARLEVEMHLKPLLSKEYIMSDIYKNLMMKGLDKDKDNLFDAANHPSSNYRHGELKSLASWRWLANFQYREIISYYIHGNLKGIDFGGGRDPIYGNTEIVDIQPPKLYRQLVDFEDDELDYIFTSHTLEHIKELDWTLDQFHRILHKHGAVICIVPAYTCERWRTENLPSHVHTFSLHDGLYENIAKIFQKHHFRIYEARYAWENCIFILATKCVD